MNVELRLGNGRMLNASPGNTVLSLQRVPPLALLGPTRTMTWEQQRARLAHL